MEFKLRGVDNESERDYRAVATLEHNLREEIGGKNTVLLEKAFEETGNEFLANQNFRGRRDILLAEICGQPIGYLAYKSYDKLLEVEGFYVNPCFRGCGIGTAMIKQVLDSVRMREIKEVKVIAPLPESRKMYERLGFKPCPKFGENGMLLHIDA